MYLNWRVCINQGIQTMQMSQKKGERKEKSLIIDQTKWLLPQDPDSMRN